MFKYTSSVNIAIGNINSTLPAKMIGISNMCGKYSMNRAPATTKHVHGNYLLHVAATGFLIGRRGKKEKETIRFFIFSIST